MNAAGQLDWLDEPPPYQKHSDTSKAAAVAMLADATTLRAQVLQLLTRADAGGATDEEIQTALKMNPSTQRPRRIELVGMGLVRDSGNRRKTRSGRYAVVWIAWR